MSVAIHFGDGGRGFSDANALLYADEADWARKFRPRSISKVFINFALNKAPRASAEALIEKLSRYLEIGGHLRIADGDRANPNPEYQALAAANEPKWIPNIAELSDILFRNGFAVRPVEFYDSNNRFHVRSRDPAFGFVERSRLCDPRGHDSRLEFSALIVDSTLLDERQMVERTMTGEDVANVFRGILDRDPDGDEATQLAVAKFKTTDQLSTELFKSAEFMRKTKGSFKYNVLTVSEYDQLYSHYTVEHRAPKDGFAIGALRDEVDIRFLAGLKPLVHTVIPRTPEYWSTLYAAQTAQGRFVAVELGAGFGPWVVKSAIAARQFGITDIRLAAVEPDDGHFQMLQQHLTHHGLAPSSQRLLKGTVGAADSVSYFPILKEPSVDWGASAVTPEQYAKMKAENAEPVDRIGQAYAEMKQYSLKTVMAPFHQVDFLHMDIQGHELETVDGSIDDVNNKVPSHLRRNS